MVGLVVYLMLLHGKAKKETNMDFSNIDVLLDKPVLLPAKMTIFV